MTRKSLSFPSAVLCWTALAGFGLSLSVRAADTPRGIAVKISEQRAKIIAMTMEAAEKKIYVDGLIEAAKKAATSKFDAAGKEVQTLIDRAKATEACEPSETCKNPTDLKQVLEAAKGAIPGQPAQPEVPTDAGSEQPAEPEKPTDSGQGEPAGPVETDSGVDKPPLSDAELVKSFKDKLDAEDVTKEDLVELAPRFVEVISRQPTRDDADRVNVVAWLYYEKFNSPDKLKTAISWMDTALRVDGTNYYYLDTLASLHHKIGQQEKGRAYDLRAVAAAKKAGSLDYSDTEARVKAWWRGPIFPDPTYSMMPVLAKTNDEWARAVLGGPAWKMDATSMGQFDPSTGGVRGVDPPNVRGLITVMAGGPSFAAGTVSYVALSGPGAPSVDVKVYPASSAAGGPGASSYQGWNGREFVDGPASPVDGGYYWYRLEVAWQEPFADPNAVLFAKTYREKPQGKLFTLWAYRGD